MMVQHLKCLPVYEVMQFQFLPGSFCLFVFFSEDVNRCTQFVCLKTGDKAGRDLVKGHCALSFVHLVRHYHLKNCTSLSCHF